MVVRRWCSSAGKVTAGLAESNGSLPQGNDLKYLQADCRHTRISSVTSTGEIFVFNHATAASPPTYHQTQWTASAISWHKWCLEYQVALTAMHSAHESDVPTTAIKTIWNTPKHAFSITQTSLQHGSGNSTRKHRVTIIVIPVPVYRWWR